MPSISTTLREWKPQAESTSDHEEWYGILGSEEQHLPGWNSFSTAVEAYDGVPTPNSTISSKTFGYGNQYITFAFTADDLTSVFECQLDNSSWSACASPKKYGPIATTGHTFRVRARNAEATEATPAAFSW